MKNFTNPTLSTRGITLLELTIVILVLMTLISVLFIGAKSYKNGADRALCVLNIRNVQLAVRSYQNVNLLTSGDAIDNDVLINEVGGYIPAFPTCPTGGDYTLVTQIPETGNLALDCSIKNGLTHEPSEHGNW